MRKLYLQLKFKILGKLTVKEYLELSRLKGIDYLGEVKF